MTELFVLIGLGIGVVFIIVPIIAISIVSGFHGPHIAFPPPVTRPIRNIGYNPKGKNYDPGPPPRMFIKDNQGKENGNEIYEEIDNETDKKH